MDKTQNQNMHNAQSPKQENAKLENADIEKMVQARVQEEENQKPTEEKKELDHAKILEMLWANELGDGLIYAHLFKHKHVYVGQAGEWMYWNGHHWSMDQIDIGHYAHADVESVAESYQKTCDHCRYMAKMCSEDDDKPNAGKWQKKADMLNGRIARLRSKRGRSNCLHFARTNRENSLAIKGDEIDCNPWALPVANGVIDLRTGELHPGRPEDYFLKASPVEWQGIDVPCPTWENFVQEIMDEKDAEKTPMADFLRRAFGYGITGHVSEQKFLVLFGKGRNGKGILTDVIQEIMGGDDSFGSLAGPIQSEMLLDQGKNRSADGPSPSIMNLRGMRIAFASETDEGQRFSAARVKWLSGADRLTGRYPHDKGNISFSPTHFLCLLTNSKPHAPANDFAFWERLLLVDFPLSFVDRKPQANNERPVDKKLKQKLQKELPGILAWLVRGCLEWQEVGLDPPQKVLEAVADYRKDEDLLGEFLEDCCNVEKEQPDKVRVRSGVIYDVFSWWYRENISAKRSFSQKSFGKLMLEKFEKERRSGNYFYKGVSIKPEVTDKIENAKMHGEKD